MTRIRERKQTCTEDERILLDTSAQLGQDVAQQQRCQPHTRQRHFALRALALRVELRASVSISMTIRSLHLSPTSR